MKSITSIESPVFKLKKRMLLLAFFLRFFFIGAEYSVILPTALIYLKSLQADNVFMGFVIAAYPFASMISLPLFGYLYDKTKRTKELLLLLNAFEIVGNLLYALPFSKWLPFCGRFISGLGDGFTVLCIGELTYLFPPDARIGILSLMELGRVFGLIIGPTLNFFIADRKYILGIWLLDNRTLPGIVMAVNWMIMEIITVFCVFNLSKDLLEENNGTMIDNYTPTSTYDASKEKVTLYGKSLSNMTDGHEQNALFDECSDDNDVMFYKEKQFNENCKDEKQEEIEEDEIENEKLLKTNNDDQRKENQPVLSSFKMVLAFEFLIIFLVDLVLWFAQTIFEILLPYITEFDYGWDPLMTGIVYMAGGLILIMVFGILIYSSGKIRDEYLLIIALVLTQISLALLIYESTLTSLRTRFYVFAITCVLIFMTIPLNLVCTKSLLTKLIPSESQGTIQGLYSSVSRIALVAGPIIGSSVFKRRIAYGAVMSIACFFTTIGLFMAMNKLKRQQDKMKMKRSIKS